MHLQNAASIFSATGFPFLHRVGSTESDEQQCAAAQGDVLVFAGAVLYVGQENREEASVNVVAFEDIVGGEGTTFRSHVEQSAVLRGSANCDSENDCYGEC